jgi:hypothetical protein
MNEAFQLRVQRIAACSGLRIKSTALPSIAADITEKLKYDAAPDCAISSALRDLRQCRPYAFESLPMTEDSE